MTDSQKVLRLTSGNSYANPSTVPFQRIFSKVQQISCSTFSSLVFFCLIFCGKGSPLRLRIRGSQVNLNRYGYPIRPLKPLMDACWTRRPPSADRYVGRSAVSIEINVIMWLLYFVMLCLKQLLSCNMLPISCNALSCVCNGIECLYSILSIPKYQPNDLYRPTTS